MSRKRMGAVACAAVAAVGSVASAAIPSIAPLASFGVNGWRAPGTSVAGDVVAAPYPYLGTTNLERGLAYNPVTGNLILVSRSSVGNGLRVLNGVTGADVGFLNQGSGIISVGLFTTNLVGVGGDGVIYVANLVANIGSTPLRVYKWNTESDPAPTVHFSSTVPGFGGTPRFGDSMDVTGSGSSTRIVFGGNTTTGYLVLNDTTPIAVASFSPAGPGTGDFRLGVTFAGSANDVWGKQTGATPGAAPVRRTTYTDLGVGTSVGPTILTTGGEMAMDYAVIDGIPYLATLDANSSRVRVYNVLVPASPVLLLDATTTTGTLAANANATGAITWGSISGNTATLYAMASNQGIQAFTVVVPEPAALGLLAPVALMLGRRRQA